MRVTKAVSLSGLASADLQDFTTAREKVLYNKDENTVSFDPRDLLIRQPAGLYL